MSYLAPSEKHLEDWIVANPQTFGDAIDYPFRRIVARQFAIDCGIADLIIAIGGSVCVVELKREAITLKAVGQVLKYTGMLSEIAAIIYLKNQNNPLYQIKDPQAFYKRAVFGVLIGASIDEPTLWACNAAGLDVFTYEYRDGSYSFTQQWRSLFYDYESVMSHDVGFAIREVLRHRSLSQTDPDQLRKIIEDEAGGRQ